MEVHSAAVTQWRPEDELSCNTSFTFQINTISCTGRHQIVLSKTGGKARQANSLTSRNALQNKRADFSRRHPLSGRRGSREEDRYHRAAGRHTQLELGPVCGCHIRWRPVRICVLAK